ncbi:MAG: hypothetical protein AUJ51_11380 [Elusimicrobia bacterium CG1_02_56_21]|nr:MAG: hypothetical protein AUJ51_11380 [Elusimicrobia bacterium CG1_02_56_21]
MLDEDSKSKLALYLAFFLTCVGLAGRLTRIEPVYNQYFILAIWSCILLTDNLAYRFKGNSLLISRTSEFIALAALSLAMAGLLELLNLRLGAWHYINQASNLSTRWTGRVLTWAAGLPSVFCMYEMYQSFGFFRGIRTREFKIKAGLSYFFYGLGAAALCLAVAAPALFRPLAVPALFLLSEPLTLRLGLPSLLREWAGGLPAKTLQLATAGLTCGLLWNWWNKSAGSGWEYAVPGPLPTALPWAFYAGFSVLGLAAYSVCSLASYLRAGKTWEEVTWPMPAKPPKTSVQWTVACLLIITSYIALRAVDSYTVKMYIGWI